MVEKKQERKRPPPRPKTEDLPDRIVDAAVALAEEVGWSALRLSDVAARLGVPARDLLACYRDKDAVADAWFARAMAAMLAAAPERFAALPEAGRLHLLMLRWFDALAARRAVTGQMLREKLYPSHPHHWVPLVFNLSRTVQWWRDAARLEARGRRRQLEEIVLTALFLATLRVWLADDTPGQERTRAYLEQGLERAERAATRFCRAKVKDEPNAATS